MATREEQSPARAAAASAAAEQIEPGMTVGFGSGRAVWKTIEAVGARWPEGVPVRVIAASERTAEAARAVGLELVELRNRTPLDLAIDGADEIDPELGLIKGGGGALLREKLVVAAASRFVVVAEQAKLVERLGDSRGLPVEVVRFGWEGTLARLLSVVPSAELRFGAAGEPFITDEAHYIVDCELPPSGHLPGLAEDIKGVTGVVEHGLFLGMADEALIGRPDGTVERLGA